MHSVSLRNAIVAGLSGLLLVGCASADAEAPWEQLHAESDEESNSPADPSAPELGQLELGLANERAKGTILPCEFWPDGSYTCCYIVRGIPICTTYDPIVALR